MWGASYKSLQGNIGLGMAIAYFTNINAPISIPLNDTQKYDLVVDIEGHLHKVQVKTTSAKQGNNYVVQLKNSGGSSGKSRIRNFDNRASDLLFVLTSDNDMYLIPTEDITAVSAMYLNESKDIYKVT